MLETASKSTPSTGPLTQFNRNGAETSYTYDANSNRLLGFTQTLTKVRGTKTLSTLNTNVTYTLDANGALTSDGLRDFEYDEANRLSKVKVFKDGEAAKVRYLHNALGQRVFKGEPEAEQTLPNETTLGQGFIDWLKSNFKWLFASAQANTSIGTGYSYADSPLPTWALLGEYDNGSAKGAGRSEYLWLPTEGGGAIPIGMYRNGKFFALHTDHLGTPRLMTDPDNKPVWQWPYSAFGNNKPTGVLKATANPKAALTNQPTLLKATSATELNLRFPGQYADEESGLFYNYYRSYSPAMGGRYTQNDPIGLEGGLNRVGYVGASPLMGMDPLGLADYVGIPVIEGHLRWLATKQGDSFLKSPFWAAEREMLNRLKRGEGSAWDVAFYRHEMAEAEKCRTHLTSPAEEALRRQKEAHDEVLREQQNRETDLYHPDVVSKHRELFSPKWFGKK